MYVVFSNIHLCIAQGHRGCLVQFSRYPRDELITETGHGPLFAVPSCSLFLLLFKSVIGKIEGHQEGNLILIQV